MNKNNCDTIAFNINHKRLNSASEHRIDFNGKSLAELKQLLAKQNRFLSNKALLSKLSDSGNKLIAFRDKLIEVIADKQQLESTTQLLSSLNISSKIVANQPTLEIKRNDDSMDAYASIFADSIDQIKDNNGVKNNKLNECVNHESKSKLTEVIQERAERRSRYDDSILKYDKTEFTLKTLRLDESLQLTKQQYFKEKELYEKYNQSKQEENVDPVCDISDDGSDQRSDVYNDLDDCENFSN